MSTPAGITKITAIGNYHGYPSFTRGRVNSNMEVALTKDGNFDNIGSAMHWYPHLNDCGSNGCVRVLGKDLDPIGKYVDVGTYIYTLPENQNSRFILKDGNLSFVADDVFGLPKGVSGNTTLVNGQIKDKGL